MSKEKLLLWVAWDCQFSLSNNFLLSRWQRLFKDPPKHGKKKNLKTVSMFHFLFSSWEYHFKKNSIVAKLVFTMKINIKKNSIFGRVHVFLLYVYKTDARFLILLYSFKLRRRVGEAGCLYQMISNPLLFPARLGGRISPSFQAVFQLRVWQALADLLMPIRQALLN